MPDRLLVAMQIDKQNHEKNYKRRERNDRSRPREQSSGGNFSPPPQSKYPRALKRQEYRDGRDRGRVMSTGPCYPEQTEKKQRKLQQGKSCPAVVDGPWH